METKGEWQFIRDQIQNRTTVNNEWHIGLMEENGTWTWASGTKLKTADCKEKRKACWPWQPHEPSDSKTRKEKVAIMSKDYGGDKGLFNNIAEYQEKGFICEIAKGEY